MAIQAPVGIGGITTLPEYAQKIIDDLFDGEVTPDGRIPQDRIDVLGGTLDQLWNNVTEIANIYASIIDPNGEDPGLSDRLAERMFNDP